KCAEEAPRERVVLERRKPEQAGQLGVPRRAHQELARDRSEDLQIASAGVEDLFDLVPAAARPALLLDDGPVEFFFAGKMAEEQRFIDAGALGNFPRCGPAIASAGKQRRSRADDLPAAVQG